jgi:hypothetical protein
MYLHTHQNRNTNFWRIVLVLLVLVLCIDFILLRLIPFEPQTPSLSSHIQHHEYLVPNTFTTVKPNLDETAVSTAASFHLRTNEFGMRVTSPGDITLDKPASKKRIAVIGDSLSFGWGVEAEQGFPALLQERLGGGFEVLNFSGPDFTSFHALKHYESLIHNFQPDILVLSLGLYDACHQKLTTAEYYDMLESYGFLSQKPPLPRFLHNISFLYSFIHHRAQAKQAQRFDLYMQTIHDTQTWKQAVPSPEIAANIASILRHHKNQGGTAILLHSNMMNFTTQGDFARVAETHNVPLLDIRAYFETIGQFDSRRTRYQMNLRRPGIEPAPNQTACLFRAYVPPSQAVPDAIFVVGNHPKLGNSQPNTIRLYDNGTNGDERANDRVWSLRLDMDITHPVYFAFTNSGPSGAWSRDTTAFVNTERNQTHFKPIPLPHEPSPCLITLPVYTLGVIPYAPLLIDEQTPLPNALGHASIANRLAAMIAPPIE